LLQFRKSLDELSPHAETYLDLTLMKYM